jgi:hypothetical protein
MNKLPESFIHYVLTLAIKSYNYLINPLSSNSDYLFEKKSELELNKPSDTQAQRTCIKKLFLS